MLVIPPHDFAAETDELLERLELLLLSGVRRFPRRHCQERLRLAAVIEHSGCLEVQAPERIAQAHELVLDLQAVLFPRHRRVAGREGSVRW